MRTLAIAQEWQIAGGEVAYVSAALPDTLRCRIQNERIRILPVMSEAGSSGDAAELLGIAKHLHAVAIVLDGYAFGSEYNGVIANDDSVSLTIDDNANLERYQTDFVLNQNAGASESMYRNRTSQTELLLGTSYALLRREFLTKPTVKSTRETSGGRILVTLGGSDPDNITKTVVDGLSLSPSADLQVRVVLGLRNQQRDEITARTAGDRRFRILQNLSDMSEQYRWADMVIAAGGSSNWEMCYFGLPRIVLVIADNQIQTAKELERKEVANNLGDASNVTPAAVERAVELMLRDPEWMTRARRQAMSMVDGHGAARCVRRLMGRPEPQVTDPVATRPGVAESTSCEVTLREATKDDGQLLLDWRNDPLTRIASRDSKVVDQLSHQQWLHASLDNAKRTLLIAEINSEAVGTVRLDRDEVCEVSWTVARESRGKGVGRKIVGKAIQGVGLPLIAFVRVTNIASRKIAEANGFQLVKDDGEWLTFQREPDFRESG